MSNIIKHKRVILFVIVLSLFCLFLSCDDETCYVCGGSGHCYSCGGKGFTKLDPDTCRVCNGTGICFNCQGSGRVNLYKY